MIVDTMTYEEIINEYDKVLENHPFGFEDLDLKKIRRFFIKNKNVTNIFMTPITKKIDDNARLYIIPFLTDKKCIENREIHKLQFMIYRTSHGMMVIKKRYRTDLGCSFYTFTSSHFFDRYRERHLKNDQMSKKEVIIDFYKTNYKGDALYAFPSTEEGGERHFLSSYETGMAIGTMVSDYIFLYKTYIDPSDMTNIKKENLSVLNEMREEERQCNQKIIDAIKREPELYREVKNNQHFQHINFGCM